MGCSITPTYKRVSVSPPTLKISSVRELTVQPGLFVLQNLRAFQEVYLLGQTLGVGKNSEVRSCIRRDTKERRAVKIFKKFNDKTDDEYKAEVGILKNLDHPNIIKVFEYFDEPRRFYMVMEFCSGGDLFSEIIKTSISGEINIAKIMQQLFSALLFLHERKIIHRDIKPENVLLEESENMLNIKIVDFGSAVISKGDTTSGFAGSSLFSSPEMIRGAYTFKADIWSAGVILCLLLTGQPPYSVSGQQIEKYHSNEDNFGLPDESWKALSNGCKDLLQNMLCPEDRRFTAKDCLNHKWIVEKSYKPLCNELVLSSVLSRLSAFHSFHKLREAVYTYIITQFISLKETRMLREVFRAIDKNSDGKLSVDELAQQYSLTMGSEEAKQEAERIMKQVDTDNNGFIDYTEFLKVNLDSQKVLSNGNLKHAFRLFDKDESGTISAAELKAVLQGDMQSEDSVWQELIATIDQNGDGEIDLEEFQDIILSNCLNN